MRNKMKYGSNIVGNKQNIALHCIENNTSVGLNVFVLGSINRERFNVVPLTSPTYNDHNLSERLGNTYRYFLVNMMLIQHTSLLGIPGK